jgi:hypothetical protein
VQQGSYSSVEDALDMALVLLLEKISPATLDDNLDYLTWVNTSRQKIEAAREQSQRGEVLSLENVLTQLQDKVQTARNATP